MNNRTARILRHYALATGRPYRALKRAWRKVPWPKRAAFKNEAIQATLDTSPAVD